PAAGVKRVGWSAATILPSAEVSRTSMPRVTSPMRTWEAATERSARVQRRIVGRAATSRRRPAAAAMSAIHTPRERPRAFSTGLSMTEMFSITAQEKSNARATTRGAGTREFPRKRETLDAPRRTTVRARRTSVRLPGNIPIYERVSPPRVQRVLPVPRIPLQHHAGPAVPVLLRTAPGGLQPHPLRHPRAQGLHPDHRGRRGGQDDRLPGDPPAARTDLPDRPDPEPLHDERPALEDRDHRVRLEPPARRPSDLPGDAERVPASRGDHRQRRRPLHRRGAGPGLGPARAGPPPLQPRDRPDQAPPDRASGPARAARQARA